MKVTQRLEGQRARIGRAGRIVAAAIALLVSGVARADDEGRGEQLYALCAYCHGETGAGNPEFLAPAIGGMAEWYVKVQLTKFRDGLRGKHFDDIAGMRMRPMSLTLRSDADVDKVAAYVASLPVTDPPEILVGGDAARGKALYTPCIACHGANGMGNQALFGSPLATTSDWYLKKQIDNFKAGVRGAAPGDQTGAMMRPMAMTLANEQAVLDVIAYVMTLSK